MKVTVSVVFSGKTQSGLSVPAIALSDILNTHKNTRIVSFLTMLVERIRKWVKSSIRLWRLQEGAKKKRLEM